MPRKLPLKSKGLSGTAHAGRYNMNDLGSILQKYFLLFLEFFKTIFHFMEKVDLVFEKYRLFFWLFFILVFLLDYLVERKIFLKKLKISSIWSNVEEDFGKRGVYIAKFLFFTIISYDCFWVIPLKDNIFFYFILIYAFIIFKISVSYLKQCKLREL